MYIQNSIGMIELRDPSANFILGWILDANQVAVLRSNVTDRGEILVKSRSISWGDAVFDSGGGTTLSPFALLGSTLLDEESGWDEDMKSDVGGQG